METLHIDILTNLPLISVVMKYYDYAYDSVRLIRTLCTHSRKIWLENQDVLTRLFVKQTLQISFKTVDHLVIKTLTRGNRYKLFKFILSFDGENFNENQDIIEFIK